jgi:ribonuclease D
MFKPTISPEEIEKLDQADFKGEILLLENRDENFQKAVEYLKNQKILGFDTETKPSFHSNEKRNMVALLQLSGEEKAILLRLTKLGLPPEIADILSDCRILKIGAAIHDDIKGLQQYHKFSAAGFEDLQLLGRDWGIAEKSVRKMSAIILEKRVSKSQQLSNWESVQLTNSQVQYAAVDAWVCLKMYQKLQETPKVEVHE